MYSIDKRTNKITLTRGDSLYLEVGMIQKVSRAPYEPEEGDSVRFALKKTYEDAEPILNVTIPTETMILHLEPSDTKELEFGNYVYDIELTKENGDVDTFIDRAKFILTEEVH